MADKKKADKDTFKKVMTYIGKYRLLMFLSIVMAALTVALTLYVPVLIGDVIDLIIGKGQVDFKGIAKLLKEIALIAAATAAVQWLMNTVNNRIPTVNGSGALAVFTQAIAPVRATAAYTTLFTKRVVGLVREEKNVALREHF